MTICISNTCRNIQEHANCILWLRMRLSLRNAVCVCACLWIVFCDCVRCAVTLCLCALLQTPGQGSATPTSWTDAVLTRCRSVCPRASAAARTEDAGPDPPSQRCVPSAKQVRMSFINNFIFVFYFNNIENNSLEQLNIWNSVLSKQYKRGYYGTEIVTILH